MTRHSILIATALGLFLIGDGRTSADDPPATTSTTTPATSTPPTSTSTSTHKLQASETITGKVVKATDTELTVRVTFHTGGKGGAHSNLGHISGGWLPHVVAGPGPTRSKPRTITQTMTYHISQVPPVKVVTDGAHPSRSTGSYSDVHVGDTVWVGTTPVTTKNGDGSSHTQKTVTGIDVLHHQGTTTTSTNPPKN